MEPMTRLQILLALAVFTLACAGCIDEELSPVVGTWEWSDKKGYTERYTFHPNHSFCAEALGAAFEGTWEEVSFGHYEVTYWNRDDPGMSEVFRESVLYDAETDRVYFPGHERVG